MRHDNHGIGALLDMKNSAHCALYAMCIELGLLRDEMLRLSRTVSTDLECEIRSLIEYGCSTNSLGPLSGSAVADLNRNAAILAERRKAISVVCHLLNVDAEQLLQVVLNLDNPRTKGHAGP